MPQPQLPFQIDNLLFRLPDLLLDFGKLLPAVEQFPMQPLVAASQPFVLTLQLPPFPVAMEAAPVSQVRDVCCQKPSNIYRARFFGEGPGPNRRFFKISSLGL